MTQPFSASSATIDGPALGAFAITASDTTDLATNIRALTIGTTAGTVSFIGWDGVTYTTGALPVGTYPLLAKRIRATGTTAVGLTGWV